jgi:hypothetical protein
VGALTSNTAPATAAAYGTPSSTTPVRSGSTPVPGAVSSAAAAGSAPDTDRLELLAARMGPDGPGLGGGSRSSGPTRGGGGGLSGHGAWAAAATGRGKGNLVDAGAGPGAGGAHAGPPAAWPAAPPRSLVAPVSSSGGLGVWGRPQPAAAPNAPVVASSFIDPSAHVRASSKNAVLAMRMQTPAVAGSVAVAVAAPASVAAAQQQAQRPMSTVIPAAKHELQPGPAAAAAPPAPAALAPSAAARPRQRIMPSVVTAQVGHGSGASASRHTLPPSHPGVTRTEELLVALVSQLDSARLTAAVLSATANQLWMTTSAPRVRAALASSGGQSMLGYTRRARALARFLHLVWRSLSLGDGAPAEGNDVVGWPIDVAGALAAAADAGCLVATAPWVAEWLRAVGANDANLGRISAGTTAAAGSESRHVTQEVGAGQHAAAAALRTCRLLRAAAQACLRGGDEGARARLGMAPRCALAVVSYLRHSGGHSESVSGEHQPTLGAWQFSTRPVDQAWCPDRDGGDLVGHRQLVDASSAYAACHAEAGTAPSRLNQALLSVRVLSAAAAAAASATAATAVATMLPAVTDATQGNSNAAAAHATGEAAAAPSPVLADVPAPLALAGKPRKIQPRQVTAGATAAPPVGPSVALPAGSDGDTDPLRYAPPEDANNSAGPLQAQGSPAASAAASRTTNDPVKAAAAALSQGGFARGLTAAYLSRDPRLHRLLEALADYWAAGAGVAGVQAALALADAVRAAGTSAAGFGGGGEGRVTVSSLLATAASAAAARLDAILAHAGAGLMAAVSTDGDDGRSDASTGTGLRGGAFAGCGWAAVGHANTSDLGAHAAAAHWTAVTSTPAAVVRLLAADHIARHVRAATPRLAQAAATALAVAAAADAAAAAPVAARAHAAAAATTGAVAAAPASS